MPCDVLSLVVWTMLGVRFARLCTIPECVANQVCSLKKDWQVRKNVRKLQLFALFADHGTSFAAANPNATAQL